MAQCGNPSKSLLLSPSGFLSLSLPSVKPLGAFVLLAGSSAPQLPVSYSKTFGGAVSCTLSLHSLKGSFIRKTKSVLKKPAPSYKKGSYLTAPLPAGVGISKQP